MDNLQKIFSHLLDKTNFEIISLAESFKALVVLAYLEKSNKNIIFVAKNNDEVFAHKRNFDFYQALSGKKDEYEILTFLSREHSPYSSLIEPKDSIHDQLKTIFTMLLSKKRILLIVEESTLISRFPSYTDLVNNAFMLKKNDSCPLDKLIATLITLGYTRNEFVEVPGEFSIKGGILDLFCPLYDLPIRIEFFDEEINTIRFFDLLSQRSTKITDEVYIIPSSFVILKDTHTSLAKESLTKEMASFEQNFDDHEKIYFEQKRNIFRYLQMPSTHMELDKFFPSFYKETSTLLDFIGDADVVCDSLPLLKISLQNSYQREKDLYEKTFENNRFSLPVDKLFINLDEMIRRLHAASAFGLLDQKPQSPDPYVFKVDPPPKNEKRLHIKSKNSYFENTAKDILRMEQEGFVLFIVYKNQDYLERIYSVFEPYMIPFKNLDFDLSMDDLLIRCEKKGVYLVKGDLASGFILKEQGIALFSYEEILGHKVKKAEETTDKNAFLTRLTELQTGSFVVHKHFGIGRYAGLKQVKIGNDVGEFMLIEYAGTDKIYLPVYRLNLLQKFIGTDSASPRLDKLGGTTWEKKKREAKNAADDIADELLKIYAKRKLQKGFAFSKPDSLFYQFESDFEFEETPDQKRTIEEVLSDMQEERPMDRLICGDVGFGKTEVAIRAAFHAAQNNKQTALLVPTTLLSMQHFVTFKNRMRGYPVNVAMINRFTSPKDRKKILEDLKNGNLDVIIGTHRILSQDIEFASLGLLVVDEEQHFGVKQKEKIKSDWPNIDILTMTATPIPRTLHGSLMKLKDLSLIATPPVNRRSIKTTVIADEDESIKEAIDFELKRGGQVYFLHNRVEDIDLVAERVSRLVPDARIAIGHGQMQENALELTMLDFLAKKIDILVCTTIIESGIDIPSVNTIIVNRADAFGLAQLYQLRGRVGRSSEQAYCYLLVPKNRYISKDSELRLEAILRFGDLGSGYLVATADLEIRGAGNLLGKKQSGHINAVGLDLFLELVDEAVSKINGETPEEEEDDPEIQINIDAKIPQDYISSESLRLSTYRRISSLKTNDDIAAFKEDLSDRFGEIPGAVKNLFSIIELKIILKKLKIIKLVGQKASVSLTFNAPADPLVENMFKLASKNPACFKFTPDGVFSMNLARMVRVNDKISVFEVIKNALAGIEKGSL